MKKLIYIVFIMLGVNMYSQQMNKELQQKLDSINKIEQNITSLSKKIDNERTRRKVLINRLRNHIYTLKKQRNVLAHNQGNTVGIKNEEYEVKIDDDRYKIELIPRKFTGRLFHSNDFKVKVTPINESDES